MNDTKKRKRPIDHDVNNNNNNNNSKMIKLNNKEYIELIKNAKNIVCLIGAGISVSVGIPDFRSPNGIYSMVEELNLNLSDPQEVFDIEYFTYDPQPFYKIMYKMLVNTDMKEARRDKDGKITTSAGSRGPNGPTGPSGSSGRSGSRGQNGRAGRNGRDGNNGTVTIICGGEKGSDRFNVTVSEYYLLDENSDTIMEPNTTFAMKKIVVVETQEEYDVWYAKQKSFFVNKFIEFNASLF